MGYYFIGENDGYTRRFDDNYNFIPDENVAAFEAGAAFDWSKLIPDSNNYSSSSKSSPKNSSERKLSSSVIRKAEEYADKLRQINYEKEYAEIFSDAETSASDAYVQYRQDTRLLSKNLASSGYSGGENEFSDRILTQYNLALREIENQFSKKTSSLNEKLDSQEKRDYEEYISMYIGK